MVGEKETAVTLSLCPRNVRSRDGSPGVLAAAARFIVLRAVCAQCACVWCVRFCDNNHLSPPPPPLVLFSLPYMMLWMALWMACACCYAPSELLMYSTW